MEKNPTPISIASTSAIIIGVIVGALMVSLNLFNLSPKANLIIVPLVTAGACYLIFIYFLKRFIYRKIKIIYKNILEEKSKKADLYDQLNLDEDLIGVVEQEVKEWGQSTRKEKSYQKRMAKFRQEFLGDVSHELKTPIFNIQGYIQTLLEGGLHDENINAEYLRKASKNIDRLTNIVADLETISKNQTEKLELNIIKFDVNQLAKEVLEEQEMQAHEKAIQLSIKSGCDRPFHVIGDRERVRQVLVNLITNGIKYGHYEGKVFVGFYDMDQNVLIEVADDGIGIPENHINRVFERFYRVDKSRSREAGGTGLGLAIVKHIVEAHNQTITVRSSPDKGSTFGFTLQKAS